jgi:hypothetical protein
MPGLQAHRAASPIAPPPPANRCQSRSAGSGPATSTGTSLIAAAMQSLSPPREMLDGIRGGITSRID